LVAAELVEAGVEEVPLFPHVSVCLVTGAFLSLANSGDAEGEVRPDMCRVGARVYLSAGSPSKTLPYRID
jgi:hypothetical protein